MSGRGRKAHSTSRAPHQTCQHPRELAQCAREIALTQLTTQCCIVGGGPAGLVLGTILARGGVDVIVLEKHADFLRDFRGDTIHPSTLQAMDELGFADELLQLPHEKAHQMRGIVNGESLLMADFSHLNTPFPFIAFMPQWDLLNFLARKAGAYPNFRLLMRTQAQALIREGDKIVGVEAASPEGDITIRADLTVACDGRDSHMRSQASLQPIVLGAPMDVLWFKLSRRDSDGSEPMGRFDAGRIFITINRNDVWQCGYVIAKGSFGQLQQRPVSDLQQTIAEIAPPFADRVPEIASWDDVKLLTVAVDRLPVWHKPGLLCIGDAAHAMSPIGGIGINLAIQDAIATANLLALKLRDGAVQESDLAAVQKRREWPVRVTQWVQVTIQNRIIAPALGRKPSGRPPWLLRHLHQIPVLRNLPARFVGIGVRPEHVTAKAASEG